MVYELVEELKKHPPMHTDYSLVVAEMTPDELYVEIVKWYSKCQKMSAILIAITALIEEQGLADVEQIKDIHERTDVS